MIDLHTHLLPGVDDGSPTAEHSAVVLARMRGEGVRAVVCTPHLNASQASAAPVAQHRALLRELRALTPEGPTLYPGWEIMLDRPGAELRAPELALGESSARLVEFPRRGLPARSTEDLLRLRNQGLVPVVAHPERYHGVTLDLIETWREFGVVIQTDAMALLGAGPMTELARAMLAAGVVDVLASDNHGDRRSLSTACQWLQEIGASEQVALLSDENPRRVLAGEPMAPVPPLRLRGSVLRRLRDLIFGARRASRHLEN